MLTDKERKAWSELDEIAERAGGYVAYPPVFSAPEHDYRKMIRYCQEKGIDCMDLSEEELKMFELVHA